MDLECAPIGDGERRGQPAIRLVVDVDQPEIVILAIGPPAFRVIVILEPVGADNFRDRGKVLGCRRGPVSPFGLGRDRHQVAVVEIAGAVVLGREKPFGDQHRLALRQFPQPVEIIGRDPAVAAVDVIIGGDRIDIGRHRPHRRGVVIDRQPVAEIERIGIGRMDRLGGESVIMPGDDPSPFAHRMDPRTPGPHPRHPGGGEQLRP